MEKKPMILPLRFVRSLKIRRIKPSDTNELWDFLSGERREPPAPVNTKQFITLKKAVREHSLCFCLCAADYLLSIHR